jgi:hypothetical protein
MSNFISSFQSFVSLVERLAAIHKEVLLVLLVLVLVTGEFADIYAQILGG